MPTRDLGGLLALACAASAGPIPNRLTTSSRDVSASSVSSPPYRPAAVPAAPSPAELPGGSTARIAPAAVRGTVSSGVRSSTGESAWSSGAALERIRFSFVGLVGLVGLAWSVRLVWFVVPSCWRSSARRFRLMSVLLVSRREMVALSRWQVIATGGRQSAAVLLRYLQHLPGDEEVRVVPDCLAVRRVPVQPAGRDGGVCGTRTELARCQTPQRVPGAYYYSNGSRSPHIRVPGWRSSSRPIRHPNPQPPIHWPLTGRLIRRWPRTSRLIRRLPRTTGVVFGRPLAGWMVRGCWPPTHRTVTRRRATARGAGCARAGAASGSVQPPRTTHPPLDQLPRASRIRLPRTGCIRLPRAGGIRLP